MKRRQKTEEFDWHAALQRAESILSAPPARGFISRPSKLSTLVFRAALPAELCLEANKLATGRMQRNPWMIGEIKKRLWSALESQALPWARYRSYWPFDPVDGVRPQVISTKFSSRSPDVGSNPAKAAIDMLQRGRLGQERRMGLITSDAPNRVEQLHCWEFQPARFPAFVLIEVRA